MAERFGADPQVAADVARELSRIRTDMMSLGRAIDGYDDAIGSDRVRAALRDFFDESSDNRENLDGLLNRGAGMLRGLAEGTTSVDTGLAGALEPAKQPTGRARR
jgi:hypothetical protein